MKAPSLLSIFLLGISLTTLCHAQESFKETFDMIEKTKDLLVQGAKEKVESAINKAIDEEIYWQLYHNWRLRVPDHEKDEVTTLAKMDLKGPIRMHKMAFTNNIESKAKEVWDSILDEADDMRYLRR